VARLEEDEYREDGGIDKANGKDFFFVCVCDVQLVASKWS
jgi:hypothetical protein